MSDTPEQNNADGGKSPSTVGLERCPFCGALAEWNYEGDDGMGRVACTNFNCGAGFFDDRDSAIAKWNRRSNKD